MAGRRIGTSIAAFAALIGAGLVTAGPAAAGTVSSSSTSSSCPPGTGSGIQAVQGCEQSTQVGTAYAQPLVALVTDSSGNPAPGALVHFSTPAAGPSITFTQSACPAGYSATDCYVKADANGRATTGTVTANSSSGRFVVAASTSTSSGPQATSFTLDNTAVPPTQVSHANLSVSNFQAGATGAVYTLTFNATNPVAGGGYIDLVFPNGTALPSPCTADLLGNCTGYSVSYVPSGGSQTSASVSSATTSKTTGPGAAVTSPTYNEATVNIAGGLLSSSVSGAVTVTITGVSNPTLASGYIAEVRTSADMAVQTTSAYAIVAGPATSLAKPSKGSGDGQTAPLGSTFAAPLVATAYDRYGNPAPGSPVTFTIGSSSGATATFSSSGTASATYTSNSNGQAVTSAIAAKGTTGSYPVTASLSSGVTPVTYTLTNSAAAPAPSGGGGGGGGGGSPTATATSGDNQSEAVTTAYAKPLGVTVTDAYGNPAAGIAVTFTAPSGGASGQFANGASTETDTTNPGGVATASTFTANTVAGSFTVAVSAADGATTAIHLTNSAGTPTAVKMVSGQGQSAAVNTAFASPFVAEAVDRYGNPVPYSSMLFGGPSSGPAGTFANGLTYEADTADASGLATASTFTANGIVGSYQLAAGLSTSNYVLFPETNTYGGATSPSGTGGGYWLTAPDGAVQAFGDAGFYGSAFGAHLAKPVISIAGAPGGDGYWLVASDGGVFNYGPGARFHGSAGGIRLAQPIVGMVADPVTGGYWLVASDGGVFSYDAPFYGSTGGIHLDKPIVGIAAAPGGDGYWLVASDGGVFAFGPGARFYGSTGNVALNRPVVGMAAAPGGSGYWLVASDGGIFAFGSGARFYGSTGNVALDYPVVGMASAPAGDGYWLVASDGGVFAFGPGARFHGSAAGEGVQVSAIAAD